MPKKGTEKRLSFSDYLTVDYKDGEDPQIKKNAKKRKKSTNGIDEGNGSNYYKIGGDRYDGGVVLQIFVKGKSVYDEIHDGDEDFSYKKRKYNHINKLLDAVAKANGLRSHKNFKRVEMESVNEGNTRHPLSGHAYHSKSEDELAYIRKDAKAAAIAMGRGHPKEGKYLDQVNDAITVSHYRRTKHKKGMPAWYAKKYGHKISESARPKCNVNKVVKGGVVYAKCDCGWEGKKRKEFGGSSHSDAHSLVWKDISDHKKTKKESLEYKKGQSVIVNKGPHKGQKHEIIHDHGDGSYNAKPHGIPASKIKYRLGAVRIKSTDISESTRANYRESFIQEMDKEQHSGGKETNPSKAEREYRNKSWTKAEAIKQLGKYGTKFNPKTDLGYWATKEGNFWVDLRTRNGSDEQLKATESKIPAGVKSYTNKWVESTHKDYRAELDEVLNFAARRAKARNMKKHKAKVKHGKQKQSHKMASADRLKTRSQRQARLQMFKVLSKGKSRTDTPIAKRISIEKRLEKLGSRISRIAQRSLPKVRKQEIARKSKKGK